MRFRLLNGGGHVQSGPGFGQRLKFIEFGQVDHGFARDEIGNVPLLLDEFSIAMPRHREFTLLVAMIPRPHAAGE